MHDSSTPSTTPPTPRPPNEQATIAPRDAVSGTHSDAAQELSAGAPVTLPRMLGRYELRKLLGKGGMGAVYLAHDGQLDRPVALKIPSFTHGANLARERFLQEARAAATVSHPNLCPVYDAGTIDGVEYLTMAYIQGRPLSALIRGGKRLPERTAAALVQQLAQAMQAAHERGIIHRDLKPDNIMITPKKQPVIMDFGLARRSVGPTDVRLTQSGALMGTPAYMSPEQVDGDVRAMGPGCDIYSLGVILYQLLTGRLPFDPSGGLGSLIAQIATDPPPSPRGLRPDLNSRLEAICIKALAKKPANRQQSMAELARELNAFLQQPTPEKRAETAEPAAKVFAEMLQTQATPSARSLVPARTRSWKAAWPWWAGGVAAATFLALWIGWLVLGSRQGTVLIALSDPGAAVEVRLDGQRLEPADLGQPLFLPAGEHELTVRGQAIEPVVQPFSVRAGKQVHVPVALKALHRIAAAQSQPDEIDELANLPATLKQAQPTPPVAPSPAPPPVVKTKPTPPSPGRPVSVPPQAELDAARQAIRQEHARQYARQNRSSWIALANRLRGQAEQAAGKPVQRYALWDEARQLAIRAAAAPLALRLCDELASAFVVDVLDLKATTLVGIHQALAAPGPTIRAADRPLLLRQAIQRCLQIVDAAVAARKFTCALDLVQRARALEDQGADDGLVPASAAEIAAVKPAFAKLETDADNAAANLQVGRFLCLALERWAVGLPLLVKSSDRLWKAAAEAELKHPADAAGHEAVAEAWARLFRQARSGAERRRLGWRARAWYDLALSELSPAARARLLPQVRQVGSTPNLSLIKPFFEASAANPNSGLPIHQADATFPVDSGYANGAWFMTTHGGHWYGSDITRYATPFACQLVARVARPPSAWYEVVLMHENGKYNYIVRVDGARGIEVLAEDLRADKDIPLGTIRPKGLRPRSGFSTLLVVGRARQLDLYLDGVPVTRTPIHLPLELGPGQVHIGIVSGSGDSTIEVQRLTVWPADGVPPLKARP